MLTQLLKLASVLGTIVPMPVLAGNSIIPADVSIEVRAVPSTELHAGDGITFTVSATNNGPGDVTSWSFVSSPIYDELDLGSFSSDCFGQLFVSVVDLENSFYYLLDWFPPNDTVVPGETITCHLSIDYTQYAPSPFEFGFSLSSYFVDLDDSNNASYVQLRRAAPAPTGVPIDGSGMLAALFLVLVIVGLVARKGVLACFPAIPQERISSRRRW